MRLWIAFVSFAFLPAVWPATSYSKHYAGGTPCPRTASTG